MSEERTPLKVLFICNQNRCRSPTAEEIFRAEPGLDVRSAGIDRDAIVVAGLELLEWADVIFVMERRQRNLIQKRFPAVYQAKRIVCLYIPDEYAMMDPRLVGLLRERVMPHLESWKTERE